MKDEWRHETKEMAETRVEGNIDDGHTVHTLVQVLQLLP